MKILLMRRGTPKPQQKNQVAGYNWTQPQGNNQEFEDESQENSSDEPQTTESEPEPQKVPDDFEDMGERDTGKNSDHEMKRMKQNPVMRGLI